ncbi:MAG: hypothetical protein HY287_03885 [Planctomycetes bacterium]|nr:hypothetical protein [Planctomycetota bacterium]MBI3833453.1 hypothetical protein [Planctomycetota bacterium]
MAKALHDSQPTSSVARLLDAGAAARAVAPHPLHNESAAEAHRLVAPSPVEGIGIALTGETPCIKRELVLTRSADETLTRLVNVYRQATATRLTTSHVARAMLKAVSHCMEQLQREAGNIGAMKLPSNARGREGERDRFEERIAHLFLSGMCAATTVGDEDRNAELFVRGRATKR